MTAMYRILIAIFISLSVSMLAYAEEPLIKAGEAKSRKSNLAFPDFNVPKLGNTSKLKEAAAKIRMNAESALKLSNYFEMIRSSAFLEDTAKVSVKPDIYEMGGFKFDSWKTIGAEYLIRGTYEANPTNKIVVEIFVYQIDQKALKLGKKYETTLENAGQIGFMVANDVLLAVTGRTGPFTSRLLATVEQNGNKEVVIMNWNGDDRTVVTKDRNIVISPNWSPDNKKIVYSMYTKRQGSAQQNLTLFMHDLATKERTVVSNRNGSNSGASFTPDGKALYLTISKNGAPDIFKINLDGDQLAQLTKGPAGAMNVEAAVSTTGEKIAFSSDRGGGKPMIYTMDNDGSNVKRLTIDGKYNSTPSWSPDGSKIAFAGQDGDITDIFMMNSDGSNLERITEAYKKKW